MPASKKTNLPPFKDIRPAENFPVYDQGHLGSCTANAGLEEDQFAAFQGHPPLREFPSVRPGPSGQLHGQCRPRRRPICRLSRTSAPPRISQCTTRAIWAAARPMPASKKTNLPPFKDIRPSENFPVYDQGHLGSCTANAICAAFHFGQLKSGKQAFPPSRLFVYYNERAMEGNIGQDAGAQIRDGIKSVHQLGCCPETEWPYDIDTFTKKPSGKAYEEAVHNKALEY